MHVRHTTSTRTSPPHALWMGAALWLLSGLVVAGAADLRSSLELFVSEPPRPMNVSGETRLVYELQLTNFAASPVVLKRIEMRDAERGRLVGNFADADLSKLVSRFGAAKTDDRVIEPGTQAGSRSGGATLTHRVSFELQKGAEDTLVTGQTEARLHHTHRGRLTPCDWIKTVTKSRGFENEEL